MKCKTGTLKRRGAKTGVAGKLACFTGIGGLRYLTDEEVGALIDFLHFLSDEAAQEGFREGWNCGRAFAECDYNGHGVALLSAGPSTEH